MKTIIKTISILTMISITTHSMATDTHNEAYNNETIFQITPYLWAAEFNGQISPFKKAPTIGIEKSFSDVFDSLNFGGFINLWTRHDNYVFSGDVMYVNTTDSYAFGPLPPLLEPIPAGTIIEGRVDSKQFMATLQTGYRVIDKEKLSLDMLGGVRIWHISNDVTVSALGYSRSYAESFGWADPIIGTRAFYRINEKISLQGQADIGGFGVGSDITWSALGTVNYELTDKFSFSTGYKILHVDYKNDGHVFDTKLQGPVIGLTYRF